MGLIYYTPLILAKIFIIYYVGVKAMWADVTSKIPSTIVAHHTKEIPLSFSFFHKSSISHIASLYLYKIKPTKQYLPLPL